MLFLCWCLLVWSSLILWCKLKLVIGMKCRFVLVKFLGIMLILVFVCIMVSVCVLLVVLSISCGCILCEVKNWLILGSVL